MYLSFIFNYLCYNTLVAGKPEPQPQPQPKKDEKPGTSGTKKKVQIVEPNKGGSIDTKKNADSSDEDDDEDEDSSDDEVHLYVILLLSVNLFIKKEKDS